MPRLRVVVVHVAPAHRQRRAACLAPLARRALRRAAAPPAGARRRRARSRPRLSSGASTRSAPTRPGRVTRGAGVVVAVVDTGVAPAPDLAGRLLPGWNVIARSDDAADDNGHGTHVAGTVAEVEGNGLAESGVAPEASILPVKVLDSDGRGQRCRRRGRHRLGSRSRGAHRQSQPRRQRGVDGAGRRRRLRAEQGRPDRRGRGQRRRARSPCPPASAVCIAVGAVDANRVRAPFSAGGRALDLVAPGVGILQQTLDGVGGYADRSWSGTSMASPHVAGVAALALAAGRATTAAGVARLLDAHGARPRRAGHGTPAYGAGLVRADAALGCGGTLSACRAARHPVSRSRGRSGCSGSTHRRARTRSATPGRSASRARTPTATPSARAPRRASRPRSTRRASCASGGSRPARRGPSRCRPRRCALPSPSASCGRRRARRSRTARPSARAISSRASFPAATRHGEPVLAVRASGHGRGRPRRARGRLVRGARRPRAGRVRLPGVREVQRPGRRAPGAAAVPGVPRGARAAGALRARGRAGAARLPLTRARRPGDRRRARRLGPRGARARALPLGRARRPASARGAPREHAGRLRARLRALGGRVDGPRRRQRARRASASRRSCRGARPRSRAPR